MSTLQEPEIKAFQFQYELPGTMNVRFDVRIDLIKAQTVVRFSADNNNPKAKVIKNDLLSMCAAWEARLKTAK